MKASLANPPSNDEVEVSIFGPGKGESVVVHLGGGQWIVVDSCVDQHTGKASAEDYLRKIGVNLSTDVRLIVATHAHDDHFAGIASLFEACNSAVFVVSDAHTSEEFHAMLGADADIPNPGRISAYSEYRQIFEIAKRRKSDGIAPLRRASQSTQLLSIPASSNSPLATVTALSPSEEARTRADRAIAAQLPQVNARKGKVAAFDPNDASIALWIQIGDVHVLLGADLENGTEGCGWKAVVATFTPSQPASLYKVAHHGGENSHHQPAWDKLLIKNPVALLTPYRRGNQNQPKASDVDRILSLTSRAYITATGDPKPTHAVRKEAAKLGTLAQNVRDVWGRVGHVRARHQLGSSDWSLEHFPPGGPLQRRASR